MYSLSRSPNNRFKIEPTFILKKHPSVGSIKTNVRACYYLDSSSNVPNTVGRALDCLLSHAKDRAYLAVMSKQSFHGPLAEYLGKDLLRQLKNKDGVIYLDRVKVQLITNRLPLETRAQKAPILALYLKKKFLDIIDAESDVSALIVVTKNKEDVEQWVLTRNAINLDERDKLPKYQLVKNRVVVEALHWLSDSVNQESGIWHPRDKEKTVQIFKILKEAGEYYDPFFVKCWLVRHGKFDAPDAERVAEVAQMVLEGRRLRGGHVIWRADSHDRWRKEAERNRDLGDVPSKPVIRL